MYCFLKYFQEKPKSELSIRAESAHSLHSQKSGSGNEFREIIFNPDCLVGVLLDFLREEIGLEKTADIELYDDAGYLTSISSCKKWNYATNVLNDKHTYFVILCERDESGCFKKFDPMVNKGSKLYTNIMFNLNKHLILIRKTSYDRRSSKSSKGSMKRQHYSKLNKKGK